MYHVWRTDKWEPVLSFHHMGSGTELGSIISDLVAGALAHRAISAAQEGVRFKGNF